MILRQVGGASLINADALDPLVTGGSRSGRCERSGGGEKTWTDFVEVPVTHEASRGRVVQPD
jgi:hypothetical protein